MNQYIYLIARAPRFREWVSEWAFIFVRFFLLALFSSLSPFQDLKVVLSIELYARSLTRSPLTSQHMHGIGNTQFD